MKKRIISLLLCVVMLAGVLLTSCSSDTSAEQQQTKVTETASKSTKTISMYVVTENDVSAEDQKAVQDAFNKITKSKFKTQVIMKFFTYDNYFAAVEDAIGANERKVVLGAEAAKVFKKAKRDAKAAGIATDEAWVDAFYESYPQYAEFRETQTVAEEETTAEETVLVTIEGMEDAYITEVKYPELGENQIDIIWLDSYERYTAYAEKEWLSRLDDELGAAAKKLKEYINNDLLAWAKYVTNGTYAIPNNHTIGEYTYLLLNKDLITKYNYDYTKLTSLANCADFLADIAKYEPNTIPVLGDLPITQMLYWTYNKENRSVSTDQFSIIGNNYVVTRALDPSSSANPPFIVKNVFSSTEFKNQLLAIQTYKSKNYITADTNTTKDYALRVVKGGAELAEEYGDKYYMNILEYPRITEQDVFGSMFAVTSYTKDLGRSMEIITYLNTNADLRNVLQYGVEGLHYSINSEGRIKRLNNNYMMNLANTGNAFIAYPEEGMDADVWKWGKLQNQDAKSSLIMSFRVDPKYIHELRVEGEDYTGVVELNVENLDEVARVSKEAYDELQAVKTVEEMQELIEKYTALGDKNAAIKANTSNASTNSIYGVYYTWMLEDKKLFVPED